MKDTIRKINELVKPLGHSLYDVEPTLEDMLVALGKKVFEKFGYIEGIIYCSSDPFLMYNISWQLTKTLSQQSEKTQNTIKQIFEDGK